MHSPFIYRLYTVGITPARRSSPKDEFDDVIKQAEKATEKIAAHTLGAPSQNGKGPWRTVGRLARHGSTSRAGRKILEFLIRENDCKNIYELGTSLGLTTLYLARTPGTTVYTFEGNVSLLAHATSLFDELNRTNIIPIAGDIDITFPEALNKYPPPDLIYIDANHRFAPTLAYVRHALHHQNDKLICVIGDIYWSKDMTDVWRELKNLPEVQISADLFEFGLLFFNKDVSPGHYTL